MRPNHSSTASIWRAAFQRTWKKSYGVDVQTYLSVSLILAGNQERLRYLKTSERPHREFCSKTLESRLGINLENRLPSQCQIHQNRSIVTEFERYVAARYVALKFTQKRVGHEESGLFRYILDWIGLPDY